MAKSSELIGKRFDRLVVVEVGSKKRSGRYELICKCDCGNIIKPSGYDLTSGNTKSCGCLQRDRVSQNNFKHGGCKNNPAEYRIWGAIKTRCYNPNSPSFKNYGARGIVMCNRWKNSFAHFIKDMGSRPSPEHSIHRPKNDGNYNPSNCVWATKLVQMNTTRHNININYNEKTQTLKQWANELDLNYDLLKHRMRRGIPFEFAIIPNDKVIIK